MNSYRAHHWNVIAIVMKGSWTLCMTWSQWCKLPQRMTKIDLLVEYRFSPWKIQISEWLGKAFQSASNEHKTSPSCEIWREILKARLDFAGEQKMGAEKCKRCHDGLWGCMVHQIMYMGSIIFQPHGLYGIQYVSVSFLAATNALS